MPNALDRLNAYVTHESNEDQAEFARRIAARDAEVLNQAVTKLLDRAGELSDLAEEKMNRALEERAQEWHEAADLVRSVAAENGKTITAEVDTARVDVLREVADLADKAGAAYAFRGDNARAEAAFALMAEYKQLALNAERGVGHVVDYDHDPASGASPECVDDCPGCEAEQPTP